jgi:DNA-binding transcriptional LysR family regulator
VGASRRVALTVPDFGTGLAAVAETDLLAAMPRRYVATHAARFGLVAREVPLRPRKFAIRAAATRVALMDAGLAWLFDELRDSIPA